MRGNGERRGRAKQAAEQHAKQAAKPAVKQEAKQEAKQETAGVKAAERQPEHTVVHNTHVRSGQQIYSPGSLVVLGNVCSGAEVVADGDIHVYGALKGRALAGLSGNRQARVFVRDFDAELVSIADIFMTCDDPAMVDQLQRSHTLLRDVSTCVSIDEDADTLAFKAV